MSASGRPKNVIVQSGVNAQTNEVTAPPKKTTPIAEASNAIILAKIAKIIFGPGKKDLSNATNVGVVS